MSKLITVENPQGFKITFDEAGHKYQDESGKIYRSVTKIIHKLFPEFERDKIAGFVARKRGVDRSEVIAEWEATAKTACDLGNVVHRYAECFLQNIEFDMQPTTDEQCQRLKVIHEFLPKLTERYEFVEAEKIIFSPDCLLAGTIDLIMKNKNTGTMCIFDWKTNKEICKHDKYNKVGKMFLSNLDNCNYNHYALQLNTYRYMMHMEGYGDFGNCELALFHVTNDGVVGYPLPDMTNHVKLVIDYVKQTKGDIW
jgi:ATP-dependent exoDNAse (exonuclease V) beta subunit